MTLRPLEHANPPAYHPLLRPSRHWPPWKVLGFLVLAFGTIVLLMSLTFAAISGCTVLEPLITPVADTVLGLPAPPVPGCDDDADAWLYYLAFTAATAGASAYASSRVQKRRDHNRSPSKLVVMPQENLTRLTDRFKALEEQNRALQAHKTEQDKT